MIPALSTMFRNPAVADAFRRAERDPPAAPVTNKSPPVRSGGEAARVAEYA